MDSLFEQVARFVAEFTRSSKRLDPNTTLFGDLGVDGDDGSELLAEFSGKFNVDMHNCKVDQHFGPEEFSLWAPIYWFILVFRDGTPEQNARLKPIRISDLVNSAKSGRWIVEA